MSERAVIDPKILERKAFDMRNEDIYQYFLCFFQEFEDEDFFQPFSFSYEIRSDLLHDFSRKYALHNIASSGSDFDRSIRLMRWVHRALPSGKDAIHMTDCSPDEVLSRNHRAVNCCNHAIVLNAALLAVGLYSRCIWCKPFDVANLEYHVVNVVYIPQYDKWIMLDSANQAVWYDCNDIPLGPMEIRRALEEDAPVRIGNGKTEWNGRYVSVRKKKYIAYMKKNCFRFSCYLKSSYLQEDETVLVELVPRGYYPSAGYRKKVRNGHMLTCQYTTNVQAFWQKPYG